MSKNTAVQPVKDDLKASEVAVPVVENDAPVSIETVCAEPVQQASTTAAVEDVAAQPKGSKKTAAAKPALAQKTPVKAIKKAAAVAQEKVAEVPKVAKLKKQAPKKPKLVRDSFTIPEADYALFAVLRQRALAAGIEVKKSEVLRAAVAALAQLEDAELIKAIGLIERIKTGRPKK